MTTEACAVAVLLALALAVCPAASSGEETFSFVYLERAEDPAYQRHRAYTGLALRDRQRPVVGATTALRGSRALGRALDLRFELIRRPLEPGEDPVSVVETLARDGEAGVFLLDLPLEDVSALGAAFAGHDLILFNFRHLDDALRGSACSPSLFHTVPSHAMLMDGLAQYLRKKAWVKVLVLQGEAPGDAVVSEAFQRSARKFGLKIAGVRPFVLSNDPRERGKNNVALLTSGGGYDVVFMADTVGEFGRYVPYQTQQPRPVVGSEGLVAGAWHWTWERHGAPQLNQRFRKAAGRSMAGTDYGAWAAVRSVVEAISRTRSTRVAAVRGFISGEEFTLDTYKGAPGSFRAWDNQLRQAVLLHTHNAVIARAPLEGFLHERNNLDTLGADRRESRCRFPG